MFESKPLWYWPLIFLLKPFFIVKIAFEDWAEKQQQTYENYQAEAKWRHDCALRKLGLKTFEESMADAKAGQLFD